ncbi:MAG: YHS domain-containing protein [Sulfolobales archaeon]
MPRDPVCGMEVPETTEYRVEYKGKTYYFCCGHCVSAFKRNPEKYAK